METNRDKEIKKYALKILTDAGCDKFTYGGEYAKHIMDDLKTGFPDGMKYHYIDVANAILKMSRPKPLYRAPYRVIIDTEHSTDGADEKDLASAKENVYDTYYEWMNDEALHRKDPDKPTKKEKENWDMMIYNCGAYIEKYNPNTDEYEEYWYPSDDKLKRMGWKPFERE